MMWRHRAVRFCGIAFGVGWLAMPLPQLMLAAGL